MQVASLHCYPIKGCRGHSLPSASIDALGVVGDRRLMLVDPQDRFLSQREEPRLATITPSLDGLRLTVTCGSSSLEHAIRDDRSLRDVTVWGSRMQAVDQGDDAADWFSDALGRPCRLVYFGSATHRRIDPAFSPRTDAETAFTDGYPLLGVLEESLEDLNGRLDEPIPMGRFRPNVVVRGAEAWSEDHWRAITIGSAILDAVKPCARCLVPTTDQATGARHPHQEPLRTLSRFRLKPPFGAIFGQNLVPRGPGTMTVGDTVSCS